MVVRRIKESDVSAVAVFEREIAEISFGSEAITDLAFHEKKILKAIKKNDDGMLVLIDDEASVIGWLWMSLQVNSVSLEKYINFRSFYVMNKPEYLAGSEILMRAGMEYSKKTGARHVVGKTFVSNLPMRLVYRKFGFKPTHITMEYFFD